MLNSLPCAGSSALLRRGKCRDGGRRVACEHAFTCEPWRSTSAVFPAKKAEEIWGCAKVQENRHLGSLICIVDSGRVAVMFLTTSFTIASSCSRSDVQHPFALAPSSHPSRSQPSTQRALLSLGVRVCRGSLVALHVHPEDRNSQRLDLVQRRHRHEA